jgi:parvulin-like peptidyl-prolyl isomerase
VLKRMRAHAKALHVTLWLVVVAFIGTTFLVWGYRSTSGDLGVDVIATVEGERIPYTDYQDAYRRRYEEYQKALGDKFDEKVLERVNLKGQVIEGLISQYIVLHEAKRLGLIVSADELAAEIAALPVFQDKEGFSRSRYLRALESARVTPAKFEERYRQEMMVRKLEQWVKASVNLLPDEAWETYRLTRGFVKAEYLLFSDPKGQQATIQRVSELVAQRATWPEIVKASGLKPRSTDYFKWDQEIERVPDGESFKEVALALEKGAVSNVVQRPTASYVIRVTDRREPDPADYEREKVAFRRNLLNRKRDQVFVDWLRQLRAQAKVKIDQAVL